MGDGTGEAVKLPDRYHVESPLVRVGHETVERGPLLFRAGDPSVYVLAGNCPPAPLAILTQLAHLHLWRLAVVRCADSRVDRRFHLAPPFGFRPGVRSILRAL